MAESIRPQNKRILAIDGGTYQGLAALLVIQNIVELASSKAGRPLLPCDIFDLISGTSSGGLVAILLGRLGLDCATAISLYKELTEKLFGKVEVAFWTRILEQKPFDPEAFTLTLKSAISQYASESTAMIGRSAFSHNCRALLVVTSDAPDYLNRTYHVRNYPTPPEGLATAPPPRGWEIHEAALAVTAAQIFMEPVIMDANLGFRDAAFSGSINPTQLALKEAERVWPRDDVRLVVSLGFPLSKLAPKVHRREWAVTPQYAQKFTHSILDKGVPPDLVSPATARTNATLLVKRLTTVAIEAEVTHSEVQHAREDQGTYHRFLLETNLPPATLVDCFHSAQVEDNIKKWLERPEIQKEITEIVGGLVTEVAEITIEEAKTMAPPPPPPETNLGYHPQLDAKRPETMVEYLKSYHVFFIIDDSSSMKGPLWVEARDALLEIAEHALTLKTDGIDLRFFNNDHITLGVQGAELIKTIFDKVQPRGRTPTGAVLQSVLEAHIEKLNKAIGTPAYKDIRPLDIIMLTDGVPSDKPKEVLIDAVKRIKASKHHPNAVGVQIVQIGDDPDAPDALKQLMYGDVGSIVDTVPYNGKLTPARLERILLGGLHPNIRAMLAFN